MKRPFAELARSLGSFEAETAQGNHETYLVPVVSFVNASLPRGAVLALGLFGLWQLAACGRSRRELDVPDAAAGAGTGSGTGGGNGAGATQAMSAGGASDAAGDCALSVKFEVSFADGVDPTQFCARCGSASVTFFDANGDELNLAPPNCEALCSTCEEPTCHSILECGEMPLMSAAETAWSGQYWATSTCGTSATACKAPACATPGRYSARFCVSARTLPPMPNSDDYCVVDALADPVCQTFDFELPASAPIAVVLAPNE